MPLPTASEFKARHPRFAALSNDQAGLYLAEAGRSVSEEAWSANDYADGVMYLAAHKAFMEGALKPTGASPGTGGRKRKVKADTVEVEYTADDVDPSVPSQYRGSTYGLSYWELALRNSPYFGAPILVV